MSDVQLICGDALAVLPTLPDASVDLIATDPPYYRVKNDLWWDKQWDKPEQFLAWIGRLCDEWRRVLRPNGSLYVFASPQMAWGVEGEIRRRFNVLNRITWRKDEGWAKRQCKEEQRIYFPASEAVIFAEQFGTDSIAKGEAGYEAKCDEARGFVFEPIRQYLDSERERSGVSVRQVAEAFQRRTGSRTVTGMAGHWFGRVQWSLPTAENYEWLRSTLSSMNHAGQYLRREYEDLRREYEDLRRPFSLSSNVPYTDVWDFPTVQNYPGKHVCEKPLPLMRHIVQASSRPGATVLDCFCGSGSTGRACVQTGRRFIGIDIDPHWIERTREAMNDAPLFAASAEPAAEAVAAPLFTD